MEEKVKLGKYKHFKNILVEVIGIAKDSETLEEMVIYKKLEDFKESKAGSLWVRPLTMFNETITRDGKTMKRFEFIGE